MFVVKIMQCSQSWGLTLLFLLLLFCVRVVTVVSNSLQTMSQSNYIVKVNTFLKYNFKDFGHNVTDSNPDWVSSVWCMTCAKWYKEILKKDSQIRGDALKAFNRFVQGTDYISKYTLNRHIESKVCKLKI